MDPGLAQLAQQVGRGSKGMNGTCTMVPWGLESEAVGCLLRVQGSGFSFEEMCQQCPWRQDW